MCATADAIMDMPKQKRMMVQDWVTNNVWVLTALYEDRPIEVIAAFKNRPTVDEFKAAMRLSYALYVDDLDDWYDGIISDGEVWDENCTFGLALNETPLLG